MCKCNRRAVGAVTLALCLISLLGCVEREPAVPKYINIDEMASYDGELLGVCIACISEPFDLSGTRMVQIKAWDDSGSVLKSEGSVADSKLGLGIGLNAWANKESKVVECEATAEFRGQLHKIQVRWGWEGRRWKTIYWAVDGKQGG